MRERKIMQIAAATHNQKAKVFALCDDGTLWVRTDTTTMQDWPWCRLPEITDETSEMFDA